MEENISSALQENIITLLCFSEENVGIVANNVESKLFDNTYYRRIADVALDYYKRFKVSPKNHIADLLEKELNGDKAELYKKILKGIYENANNLNEKYVIDELEKFIRTQNLKIAIIKAAENVQQGNIEKAEEILESARKKRISVFDPGVFFNSEGSAKLFDSLDSNDEDLIYTGIKTLDDLEHVPTRRELYFFMALAGKGKSWFLNHLSKHALLQRKKVLHVSLELGEKRLISRYFQTLFGVASKESDLLKQNPVFETDKFGNLMKISFKDLVGIKTLRDGNIVEYLQDAMEDLIKPYLIIKEFPSGSLSVSSLRAYLDNLEAYYNFIPDIILLDYLDLMYHDAEKMRIDLGRTGVELRGIAQERNVAMVTVAQSNRAGEDKTLLTRKNIGEDYSKVKTGDVLITYNQTPKEKEMGLARLYIDKGRNGRDGDLILVSQNYSLGQFCLDSVRLRSGKKYWDVLENGKGEEE